MMEWLPWLAVLVVALSGAALVTINNRAASKRVEDVENQQTELMQQLQQLQQQREQLAMDNTQLATQLEQQQLQQENLQHQLQDSQNQLQSQQMANANVRESLASTEAKLQAQEEASKHQLAQLQQSKQEFEDFLKQYAEASLNKQSEQLNASNKQQLDLILTPLRDQLGDFRKRVDDVYTQESQDRRGLAEQINQLKQLNSQLSSDAINLTKALKGDNKAQGNWGEMVLEKVLERSGLRKDHEYFTQVNLTQASGKRLQPDAVVRLPDDKDVIIDSKVSLIAYDRYLSAENDEARQQALDEHLQSIKGHIKNLSGKSYEGAEGVRTLDYVLLFIPVESAYMLALQSAKGDAMFVDAMERNIVLVSPATLLMVLRTIHNIWRYEHQNQNAKNIADQARKMYDKFVGFVNDLEGVGSRLRQAQVAYDGAMNKLSIGNGNLVGQSQKIIKLGGIKPKKEISEDLRLGAEETFGEDLTSSSLEQLPTTDDEA